MGWHGFKPLIQKRVEQGCVFCAGDVDPVTRGQAVCHCSFICFQADEEFGHREACVDESVKPVAKLIFGLCEQVSAEKEAGKIVKV